MKRFLPFILFFLWANYEIAQTNLNNIRFRHLSVNDGLPHGEVWHVLQDKQGFIWIGTYGGLCRYDGYNFKIFKYDPDDSTSISDNSVFAMVIDDDGNIWCGNRRAGISVLNTKTCKFKRYNYTKGDSVCINANDVRAICKDKTGTIWVGTGRGICKYDKAKDKFIQYLYSETNNFPRNIFELFVDSKNNLWVGGFLDNRFLKFNTKTMTFKSYMLGGAMNVSEDKDGMIWAGVHYGGVYKIDSQNDSIKHYTSKPEEENSLTDNDFWRGEILIDSENNAWLGTESGGLNLYDRKNDCFIRMKHNANDPYSLSDNAIRCVFEDRTGLIYVGTENGLNIYDKHTAPFRVMQHDVSKTNTLIRNNVVSIYENNKGLLWFTTSSEGISSWDSKSNKFTNYYFDPKNKNSFTTADFIGVIEDKNAVTWAFTFGGRSSYTLDPKTNTFKPKTGFVEGNAVLYDKDGDLWWGTNGFGATRFITGTGKTITYGYDPKDSTTLSSGEVTNFLEGSDDIIWIGTSSGLNALNKKTGKAIQYRSQVRNPNSLSHNVINCVYQAKNGLIWVGTMVGLNSINLKTKKITHYLAKDGLPHDNIEGILEDDKNNLWISTSRGLCKFSPEDKRFSVYDITDGLPSNEFILGSALKSKEGRFYFGTSNGVVSFSPDEINDNNNAPKIVITDFTVLNKKNDLTEDISGVTTLTLNYHQYFFTLELAALDFSAPIKNQYAYKLEGFNEDWIYTNNKRDITFTNLNAGEYQLKVKASNNRGVWSNEAVILKIIISPPWWKTKTFYMSCLICLVLLVYGFVKWRERKLVFEQKVLKQKITEATTEITEQKELIEQRNKEVLDSIHYASRIQKALMISEKSFEKIFGRLKGKKS